VDKVDYLHKHFLGVEANNSKVWETVYSNYQIQIRVDEEKTEPGCNTDTAGG